MRSSLARASLLIAVVVALLAVGCGGSSDSSRSVGSTTTTTADASNGSHTDGELPAQARVDARAVAQKFLDSLAGEDAEGFCEVTLPEIQRSNFRSSQIPPGSCEERAQAMFEAPRADGTVPFWAAAAQGRIGPIRVHCAAAGGRCAAGIVEMENLPLRGGGTTTAPLPVSFVGGHWRVGES